MLSEHPLALSLCRFTCDGRLIPEYVSIRWIALQEIKNLLRAFLSKEWAVPRDSEGQHHLSPIPAEMLNKNRVFSKIAPSNERHTEKAFVAEVVPEYVGFLDFRCVRNRR